MLVIFALLGFLVGWAINIAAQVLPRYAGSPPDLPPPDYLPATLIWLRRGQVNRLHLTVEWLMVMLALLVAWRLGASVDALLLVGLMALFLLIAVIDLQHRLILNIVTYPALALALLMQLVILPDSVLNVVIGGVFAFSIFFIVARMKPGDLGGGDVKLAALIGVVFGFPNMLWALIVGGTAGALAAIYLVVRGSSTLRGTIPYAPFLCAGAMIALMYNPLTMG